MITRCLASLVLLALLACSPPEEPPAVAEPAPPVAEEPIATTLPLPTGPAIDYQMSNAAVPLDGVLTGGQPTAEDLEKLAERGYRTVITLRMPAEDTGLGDEQTLVEGLGMRYVALPVDGADGLTRANAERLSELLAAEERPILLHCGSSNRVGALLALEAFYVDGADPDAALELGKSAGLTRLEPAVRERLDAGDGG